MDLIIVTGLSGAGKSTVIHAMEDIGYFCVDNLPVKLIVTLVNSLVTDDKKQKLAVVSDVRAGITPDDMQDALNELKNMGVSYKVLFIDCKTDILLNRFRLERRSHPLSDNCISVTDAVSIEKKLMLPFRRMADYIIDTSFLTLNACKNRVFELFGELEGNHKSSVRVQCVSFGFKHGIPADADYVFDVRSLPNPYYVNELKSLLGTDERVSSFVMGFPESQDFFKHLTDFCNFAVPLCIKDGRSQLIIAIGCTGGHHRSVTLAELLHKQLKELGYKTSINHRDVNK